MSLDHEWNHCELSRAEAERRLWATGPQDGAWLVRASQSLDQRTCLSVWSTGRFFHIIVPVNRAGLYFLETPSAGFTTLAELLTFYQSSGRSFTANSGEDVRLLYPCPRPNLAAFREESYCNTSELPSERTRTKLPVPAPIRHQQQYPEVLTTSDQLISLSRSSGKSPDAIACEGNGHTHQDRLDHRQGKQRHNADDQLPVLLEREVLRNPRRPSIVRRFAAAVASCVLCFCTSRMKAACAEGDNAKVDHEHSSTRLKSNSAPTQKALKQTKAAEVGLAIAPCTARTASVNGASMDDVVAEEMAKPIVFADEVAKILQAVHEQRKLAGHDITGDLMVRSGVVVTH